MAQACRMALQREERVPKATGAALVFGILFIAVFTRYFRLWIQSKMTRAGIGIFDLLAMTFRKVDPRVIVRAKIMATQAGMGEPEGLSTRALEAHYLAGGNVPLVTKAIIAAHKARLSLGFKLAAAAAYEAREEGASLTGFPAISSGGRIVSFVAPDGALALSVSLQAVQSRAYFRHAVLRSRRGDSEALLRWI